MLYDLTMKIYDKSKEEKVDLRVAYEKVAQEIGYADELMKAYTFGTKFYNEIVYLRTKNKLALLKTLAGVYEKEGSAAARAYVQEQKDRGEF